MRRLEVQKGFAAYTAAYPEQRAASRSISHALRIARIDTMEQLRDWYRLRPDELLKVRGIGPARLDRIGEILQFYAAMAPPGKSEECLFFAQGAPCISGIAADNEPLSNRNMKEVLL